jgi:class 3 adenylate cyclase/CHASE2 domain-containing sensor protein
VSRARGAFRRVWGIGGVVAIALTCLVVTILLRGQLAPIEDLSADYRMRLRLELTHEAERVDTTDIVLLAIDQATEDELGRYGAGQWLSRGPFLDQLRFARSYLRPTVLAYDIIFKDTQGRLLRAEERITDIPERAARVADEVESLSQGTVDSVSDGVLADLSRLALEQGNTVLAHGFAGVWEDARFRTVLGYNFRGGWDDPQSVDIPVWSSSGRGAGESGVARVPYLVDLAIPESSVHFSSPEEESLYACAPNGNLPSPDVLDYVYLGCLNIQRDADGLVRRAPLVMGFAYRPAPGEAPRRVFVPTFALLSVLLHLGIDEFPMGEDVLEVHFGREIVIRAEAGTYRIPIDYRGRMRLNYRWKKSDFAEVSFSKLAPSYSVTTREERYARAREWAGVVRNRIAAVGVTVTGVDVGPTPIDANTPLVYVQLTAMNNILTRSCLLPMSAAMQCTVIFVLFAGFVALCLAVRGIRVVVALGLFLVLYLVLAYGGVHAGITILPVAGPMLFMVTAIFGVLSLRYFTESRARRRIRGMFSTMVSGTVLSYLEDHPGSFSLEGHTTDATVLFSDITDFTALSEHLSPEDLIDLLNMYLTPVTDCVLKWGGYLDKYVGDCVMAVWGAPYPDPDHAMKACLSALEQQRIVSDLNRQIKDRFGFNLRVRIGINSGRVTAGNVGSERKFQYTVLGDPVNLAARLEPANREFGTGILMGKATEELVSDQLEAREIGRILVYGRQQIASAYELLGRRGELDEDTLLLRGQYDSALQAFYMRDWPRVIETLETILAIRRDGPSLFLLEWARRYLVKPPPPDWKGVYVRAEKD